MTLNQSALLELTEAMRTADDGKLMRTLLHTILQALVDAEATEHIGAGMHEQNDTRTTQRNGTRTKVVSTTSGDLAVKIAKTRTGSFFPTLLHPRRRIDVALHAVVMEAYVHGVSTRKVDDLVVAMGAEAGISKSGVSRICAELDVEVAAFNTRDLSGQAFPYVFLDATYCKARVGGDKAGKGSRVASQAVVIATGVSADGRREVLGCAVGDSETTDFWTEFLRGLRDRGLGGVQLVISDHHRGLMNAIDTTMAGAAWQRCRVHFMRNVLAKVPKGHADMVAAAIRTIFAQPTGKLVREQVEVVAVMLEPQLPAGRDAAQREGGDHRVRRLPRGPLAQDLVDQPVGTVEPRGQAQDRCGRDLSQRRRTAPALGLCADRGPRRVAGRRAPLPLRRIDGPAHPAGAHRPRHRHDNGPGGNHDRRGPERIV